MPYYGLIVSHIPCVYFHVCLGSTFASRTSWSLTLLSVVFCVVSLQRQERRNDMFSDLSLDVLFS